MIIRFNRHENMNGETRGEILRLINEIMLIDIQSKFSFENCLYGLFDGYYYKESLAKHNEKLRAINPELSDRLTKVIAEVETYPIGVTEV